MNWDPGGAAVQEESERDIPELAESSSDSESSELNDYDSSDKPEEPDQQDDVADLSGSDLGLEMELPGLETESCDEFGATDVSSDGEKSLHPSEPAEEMPEEAVDLEPEEDSGEADEVESKAPVRDYSALPLLTRKGLVHRSSLLCNKGLSDVLLAGVHESVGSRCLTKLPVRDDSVVRLFAHQNYTIDVVLAGAGDPLGSPLNAVVDTGAGPCFIRRSDVPSGCTVYELPSNAPGVVGANGEGISLGGVVEVLIQIGTLAVKQSMIVSETLPVSVVLGTSFIDCHVDTIAPKGKFITLSDSSQVPIVSQVSRKGHVRCARYQVIPPRTVAWVPVCSDFVGLGVVTPMNRGKRNAWLANGLLNMPKTSTEEPAYIQFTNFGDSPAYLDKRCVIGVLQRPSTVALTQEKEPAAAWEDLIDTNHLDEEQTEKLFDVLRPYSSLWDGKLGTVENVKHRIDTGDSSPVWSMPHRAGPAQRDVEKAEVKRMLELDVIEPSQAEWASPVVLVPKPDGSTRFCIDYRRLNSLTKRDSYPLPRMDEFIDSLGDANFFTTLDANSGYWQVLMDEASKDKTSFTCHAGFYRFKRLPFGLINAPATFQRALDLILSGVRYEFALVYLDDIIIFSKTFDEHMAHLSHVLGLLKDANISLKLKKCAFAKQEVQYLGHMIKPGHLEMLSARVESLKLIELPKTKKEVRSFLGLASLYRRFVKEFAKIAKPLHDLTKAEVPSVLPPLTEEQVEAFESLKEALSNPPTLALPKKDGQYVLDTDASMYQIGCCLQQKDERGKLKPLGYWSRVLRDEEIRYSTVEKEALAVVWSVVTLRPYLEGVRFIVRSDQSSLAWVFKHASDDNKRLARFRLKMIGYDFSVQPIPGIHNGAADCMSRLPTSGLVHDDGELWDDIPCLVADHHIPPRPGPLLEEKEWDPITLEEFRKAQEGDETCERMRAMQGRSIVVVEEDSDGILVRVSNKDGARQRIVPKSLRERVLCLAHYPKCAGHPGRDRMFKTLRRDFFWPRMSYDVSCFVTNCPSCSRKKLKSQGRTSKMKLFPPSRPLEFVALDILGPLPETKKDKNRFVLVIGDRYSKVAQAVPLRKITAHHVAHAFFKHWILPYGVPLLVLSDNGSQFAAKFFQAVCAVLGMKQLFTSTYHPQTNGQIERFNRVILERLLHYVNARQDDWDEHLGPIVLGYNSQVHASTGFSPFELALTRSSSVPVVETSVTKDPAKETKAEFRKSFFKQLEDVAKKTRETLDQAQARYKKVYDDHVRERNSDIEPGDLVLVKTFDQPAGLSPKLLSPAAGPYAVLAKRDDNSCFRVRTNVGDHWFNSDRVTKCPAPADLPCEVDYVDEINSSLHRSGSEVDLEMERRLQKESNEPEDVGDTTEYVVDRLMEHGHDDLGELIFRVRWYACGKDEDTWEPWHALPDDKVQRYMRRHKVPIRT